MEENKIFQEQQEKAVAVNGKKPMDTPALVLGIVALLASPFIPLISYICGIIGLVFAIKHRKDRRTTAALILCIVGLICGVVSNVVAAIKIAEIYGTMMH